MRIADLAAAAQHYQQALTLFQQIDAKLGQANTLIGLGDLHDRLGRPDEALKSYQAGLNIFEVIQDRYSIARTILLSLGPFLIRQGQIETAFRAYATGLRVTLEMDPQFFIAFQRQVIEIAQELAPVHPDQAAAGCAALLAELQPALEEARQKQDEQLEILLGLTTAVFQVIGLASLAAEQSGSEQAETLAQARQLAGQVDQATGEAFELVAWLETMG
jgi:tetratricopeptide (TPR) repeat protein